MTTPQDVQQFTGRTAVGSDGSKIGNVGQVYLDEQTGQPLWVTVTTGMFGTRQSFAPVYGSRFDGDQVVLAVSKDMVKDAPNIDDDGRIDASEQDALCQHYAGYLGDSSLAGGGQDAQYQGQDYPARDREDRPGEAGVQGRDTSGPGADITEEEHTLRAEQPVVAKETVPVEQVRLGKETVTEDQEVSETLRKEPDRRPGRRRQPARRGPLTAARQEQPGTAGAPGTGRTSPALHLRGTLVKVSKDQIVQLLETQGDHGKAQQASQQLPGRVDTDNPQHAGQLSRLGVDKDSLGGQLGGLGKTL